MYACALACHTNLFNRPAPWIYRFRIGSRRSDRIYRGRCTESLKLQTIPKRALFNESHGLQSGVATILRWRSNNSLAKWAGSDRLHIKECNHGNCRKDLCQAIKLAQIYILNSHELQALRVINHLWTPCLSDPRATPRRHSDILLGIVSIMKQIGALPQSGATALTNRHDRSPLV